MPCSWDVQVYLGYQQSATRPQYNIPPQENGNQRQGNSKKEQPPGTGYSSQRFGMSRAISTQQGSSDFHDQEKVRCIQQKPQTNASGSVELAEASQHADCDRNQQNRRSQTKRITATEGRPNPHDDSDKAMGQIV
jgi:hypothetical protein